MFFKPFVLCTPVAYKPEIFHAGIGRPPEQGGEEDEAAGERGQARPFLPWSNKHRILKVETIISILCELV